ncbi:MCE family protein [Kutzneria albida]|uniref:ABC transporter substrate-binding protein n=1 Tax=Kutzneria albida DSM 43870 TaxID=1449976 RepID=W5WFT0_9PSEU|nr:MCE family protein [Kutzneria albida]AHH99672.1 hypothetical protein KALB_6312 [Kutzneria albida DSM 43870]
MNAPKLVQQLVGLVYLLVIALAVWFAVAVYRKDLVPVAMVTLRTDHVGNQLHTDAEVKVRGVVVGEVRAVRTEGNGAVVDLALRPDMIGDIPRNVAARLLPKTLFGERYVNLVPPSNADPRRLAAGDVIGQDRSSAAVEVEKVLGDLVPMLQAVQPQKLASILSTMAQVLSGRGQDLGQTLKWLSADLAQFNPKLAEFDTDMEQLAKLTDNYDQIAPQILQTLSDLTTTSRTVVDQRDQLTQLYANLTSSSQDLADFFAKNGGNIIRLSQTSLPTLQTLARYSPEYPCLLRSLTAIEPLMDKVLGKDTGQPGLHVSVQVVQPQGKYVPGRDTPSYRDSGGPACYPSPGGNGFGLANSVQENDFLRQLVAPAVGEQPSDLPGWSSVLLGSLYRGTEVTVR